MNRVMGGLGGATMRAILTRRWLWVALATCWLLVLSYGALSNVRARAVLPGGQNPADAAESHSLDELCQDQFDSGWQIKHPPDLPGPYKCRLPGTLYYHPQGGSSTVRLCDATGVVMWEEKTRPGIEFHTVVLETVDGRLSRGLLVRSN
jgi:hypothetical protein